MKYQIPKGLFDILPYGEIEKWKSSYIWNYIEKKIKEICKDYNYKEIRTPIFERTELFIRSAGESSDIVKKEMYTFEDKAKRSMTLRPEGTACTLRAVTENNLLNISLPHKFFYIGPMFRYDRPQAGRYRQHHQFGVEIFYNKKKNSFYQDVEIIDLLYQFYQRLGLKNLTLYINSVGDEQTRANFKQALKKYLKPHFDNLSKDSKERFEKNPLRILDSKEEKDKELLKNAPSILDFLSEKSKKHFDSVCKVLKTLNIPYIINDKLVRGLDYYSDTVFEVTAGKLGAQNSIGGGGCYEGLVKEFGGPEMSAFGFGTGIERIIQTMIDQNIEITNSDVPFLYFLPLDDIDTEKCMLIATELRHKGIPTEISYEEKKIQKALKFASNMQTTYVAIIGQEEREKEVFILKNMKERTQETVPQKKLINHILDLYKQ